MPLSFFPDVRDPDDNSPTPSITDALFIFLPGVPWVIIRSLELCLSCTEDNRRIQIAEVGQPLMDCDSNLAIEPDYDVDPSGFTFTVASLTDGPGDQSMYVIVYLLYDIY